MNISWLNANSMFAYAPALYVIHSYCDRSISALPHPAGKSGRRKRCRCICVMSHLMISSDSCMPVSSFSHFFCHLFPCTVLSSLILIGSASYYFFLAPTNHLVNPPSPPPAFTLDTAIELLHCLHVSRYVYSNIFAIWRYKTNGRRMHTLQCTFSTDNCTVVNT